MQKDMADKLDRLAWILDSSIPIPGTPWKIGLDGLIGLIPGIGDISAGVISSYILFQALRLGVPPLVLGVIPVVGDIFDFAFKANQRNVALMREYVISPNKVKRRSLLLVLLIVLGLIGVLVAMVWMIVYMLSLLISAF